MAGKLIKDAESVSSANAVKDYKIPCSVGDGSAKTITIENLLAYCANILGLPSIPDFSETESYKAPDLVKYNGNLWQFVSVKEAGQWDETKVQQTSLYAQLNTLRQGDDEEVEVTVSSADNALTVEGIEVLCKYDSIELTAACDSSGVATFSIPHGKVYSLSVSAQDGYYPISPQSFKSLVDKRYVSFPFSKTLTGTETVHVRPMVSGSSGEGLSTVFVGSTVTCAISGGETMTAVVSENGWATFEGIPIGSTYTLTYPQIENYSQPEPDTLVAQFASRTVIPQFSFYVGSDAVLIHCNDGMEYTYDAYIALEDKPTPEAIHVAPSILTSADSGIEGVSGCDFYMALDNRWASKQWCNQNTAFNIDHDGDGKIDYVTSSTSENSNDCRFNYKGVLNTRQIQTTIEGNTALTSAVLTYTAEKTISITVKDGEGNLSSKELEGFVPEYGQLLAIKTAQGAINAIRTSLGLTSFNLSSGNWWSSTQNNSSNMWLMTNGSPNGNGSKATNITVMPLYAY